VRGVARGERRRVHIDDPTIRQLLASKASGPEPKRKSPLRARPKRSAKPPEPKRPLSERQQAEADFVNGYPVTSKTKAEKRKRKQRAKAAKKYPIETKSTDALNRRLPGSYGTGKKR
jgi:hypothetical protein